MPGVRGNVKVSVASGHPRGWRVEVSFKYAAEVTCWRGAGREQPDPIASEFAGPSAIVAVTVAPGATVDALRVTVGAATVMVALVARTVMLLFRKNRTL